MVVGKIFTRLGWGVLFIVIGYPITSILTIYGPKVVDRYANREMPKLGGEWVGFNKEWCSTRNCKTDPGWRESTETLKISQWGPGINATIETGSIEPRIWQADGNFRDPVLALSYVFHEPAVKSIGTYILRADAYYKRFLGYRVGYDKDLDAIVLCPYVLLKKGLTEQEQKDDAVKNDWLTQQCHVEEPPKKDGRPKAANKKSTESPEALPPNSRVKDKSPWWKFWD